MERNAGKYLLSIFILVVYIPLFLYAYRLVGVETPVLISILPALALAMVWGAWGALVGIPLVFAINVFCLAFLGSARSEAVPLNLFYGVVSMMIAVALGMLCDKRDELEREIERREAAEKLHRAAENKYKILVDNCDDGIVIIQDRVIQFINNKLLNMTGYKANEVIDHSLADFIAPRFRSMVLERYEKRIKGEVAPLRYEAAVVAKDGEEVPVDIIGSLIEYRGRSADMALLRDITKFKREIDRLKRENDQLRTASGNPPQY